MRRNLFQLFACTVMVVAACHAGTRAQLWTPDEKLASAAVTDGNEHTLEVFCQEIHNACAIGLQFANSQSLDQLQVDYATLTGHAYEPALGGQTLQYWLGNGWQDIRPQITIDYREQGTFAPVEGDGFSRWTYRFPKLETSRIRILLTQPANVEAWHRLYAVREIGAAFTGAVPHPGQTQTLGAFASMPSFLRPNENLAVTEAGAHITAGQIAEVRWQRKMEVDTVAWSPGSPAAVEWWDGERYRPVEPVLTTPAQPLRFFPISTTALRVRSQAKPLRILQVSLSSEARDYSTELEQSRIDLLGMRFRQMDTPDLAGMRGLLLPLDFAQIAIGRPADLEETHVTWNGTFLMVENAPGGNWNHGSPEHVPVPDRHDRWFTFSTAGSNAAGAAWVNVRSSYLDDWLPAPVITWRDGVLEYRETVFVTAPPDVYGTAAELSVRNISAQTSPVELALALGRRANARRAAPGSPLGLEPESTGYRLNADGRTVLKGDGEVILYADSPGTWDASEREDHLRYSFVLAPHQARVLHFFAPSVTEPIKTIAPLQQLTWSTQLAQFRLWWNATLDRGMKLDLPEPGFNAIYKNLLAQALIITQDGDTVKYGSYSYEDYFGIEEGWPAIALAQYGQSDAAEKALSIMLSPALMDKGNYHHQYRNGLEPWYAITAYRLNHNRAWLQKMAPALKAAADWTIQSTNANADAKYLGILPRHAYGGDIHTPAFSFYSNATCWRGLHDTALAFRELGQPDLAARYEGSANQYRTRLLSLADQLADKKVSPVFLPMAFDIGDGAEHRETEPAYDFLTPDVPESFQWTYLGNFWNLFAPMFLELKLFDPSDPRSLWIPDYMSDHGGVLGGLDRFTIGLDQIYGKGYYESLLEHGDRVRFATSLYGILSHGMSQNLNSFPEVAGVFNLRFSNAETWKEYQRNVWDWGFPGWTRSEGQPLSAGPGMALQILRMTLVREPTETEHQDTLRLLDGVPAAWFAPGKKIVIRDAPTFFGKISLEAKSSQERFEANIQTSPAFTCRQIVLHVSGHDATPPRGVTVNGKAWTDFDNSGEVRLPGTGSFNLVVLF